MLNNLIKILELSESLSPRLRYDFNNPTHRYAVSFWGTLIEHASSIVILLKQNSPWGVESILRTMVEAFFDLINLEHVENYYMRLEFNSLRQAERLNKERQNKDNPFVIPISEQEPSVDFTERLNKYIELGISEITIKEKFGLTESGQNIYQTVYWALCQETHNNMSALVRRHFLLNKDNKPIGLKFFNKDNDAKYLIDSVAGILANSMKTISEILKIDLNKEIADADEILKTIRA